MNCGLTILKLARDLQQVLSSQDPLTPWHLHSTFMFRSRSCKRFLLAFFLYLYFLDIFHIDSLLLYFSCYFCFVIAADVGFSLREIFLPRFPPPALLLWMPEDNGVNFSDLLSLTQRTLICFSLIWNRAWKEFCRTDPVGQDFTK